MMRNNHPRKCGRKIVANETDASAPEMTITWPRILEQLVQLV